MKRKKKTKQTNDRSGVLKNAMQEGRKGKERRLHAVASGTPYVLKRNNRFYLSEFSEKWERTEPKMRTKRYLQNHVVYQRTKMILRNPQIPTWTKQRGDD